MKRADTLAQNDAEKIVHLYATDAVLSGTFSPPSDRIRRRAGIIL